MAKYSSRQQPPPPRPYKIHPIWRGIGCLLVLIGPPLAFLIAHLLVDMNIENGWYPIPGELMRPYTIPGIGYTLSHLYATLIVAMVLILFGIALIMIVYTTVYSLMGPKRYGPLDAPPVREMPHKKKRR